MRKHVAPIIKRVLEKILPSSIINGFRKTGLFPLDADAIDYSKCLEIQEEDGNESSSCEPVDETSVADYKTAIKVIEKEVGEETCKKWEEEGGGNVLSELYETLKRKANPLSE